MKIAMVTHYFESHRGGIEFIAGGLLRALASLGHKGVWLACDVTPAPELKDVQSLVLPATNVLEDRLGIPIPLPTPVGIARLFLAIRHVDAVLVHDLLYPTSVVAFVAARIWRKPLIVAAHVGSIPFRNRLARLAMEFANKLIVRPLLKRADRVAFFSEITARYFATVRFRSPPAFIFNGIDTDIFHLTPEGTSKADIRERLGLPADRAVALFVGRFVQKKGLHILRRMAQQRPQILWALAGWGVIDPGLWQLPNVRIFPDLSGASLAPLYQSSDVFVLPSIGEGYPLVIQEAIACGLPVICGDETARADREAHEFLTPIPIDQRDDDIIATDFCVAVDRALNAPTVTSAVAARARFEFALQQYSWIKCGTKCALLIESSLPSGDHARPAAPPAPASLAIGTSACNFEGGKFSNESTR